MNDEAQSTGFPELLNGKGERWEPLLFECLNELKAEIRQLRQVLAGNVKLTPDAWTAEALAKHYKIPVKAGERIIRKHGIPVDGVRRLPEWKRRKLEESGPHFLATYR